MKRTAENFSIVCGTAACNASCPFCVSKMTGIEALGLKPTPINWRNFEKACLLAKDYRVGSVMITGKGEPTLFPDQVTNYLTKLEKHSFPLIDLQTNGIKLAQMEARYEPYLKSWYDLGLAFIALSVVHFDSEKNRGVYLPRSKEYIDLPKLVDRIHDHGFSVRFSCTLIDGFIDSPENVCSMISFAKSLGVEQLTLRKVAKADSSEDPQVGEWTLKHLLSPEQSDQIGDFLEEKGKRLSVMGHGAILYDVGGQNVCYTNALTLDAGSDETRQIIFFPNGRIAFDWQYQGATIL